jgi:hypothetical protein
VSRGTTGIDSRRRRTVARPWRFRRTRDGAPSPSAASALVAVRVFDPDFGASAFFAVDFLVRAVRAGSFAFGFAAEPSPPSES